MSSPRLPCSCEREATQRRGEASGAVRRTCHEGKEQVILWRVCARGEEATDVGVVEGAARAFEVRRQREVQRSRADMHRRRTLTAAAPGGSGPCLQPWPAWASSRPRVRPGRRPGRPRTHRPRQLETTALPPWRPRPPAARYTPCRARSASHRSRAPGRRRGRSSHTEMGRPEGQDCVVSG
jgi:hypothetical protein